MRHESIRELATRLLVAGVLLAAAGSALAASTTLRVTDVAVIDNGAGASRILFQVEPPALPEGAVIHRATLEVPLSGAARAGEMTLEVLPVTRAWDAGTVRWSGGWQEEGGDVLADVYTRREVDLARGTQTVGLDLTSLLKAAYEEGEETYGFLIRVPTYAGAGLPTADASRFAGLGGASVRLVYKTMPLPPEQDQARARGKVPRSKTAVREDTRR